ncbi:alpha/beta hydrolase [Streptomyces sp. CC219B]|uniref:alpha/beta fold hydrolase n=1 Tax=Streptomyces sp. CC219B TaxID=3044574 RepID=UPI0024A83A93|nr:alpha/beta hydrolase [Streptomyces sp. CC219B]
MNEKSSVRRRTIMAAGAAAVTATIAGPQQGAVAAGKTDDGPSAPTIVLVHGAFADGSSWGPVIERLQRSGHHVVAAANPLRGLAADAAHVRGVLAAVEGPVVLVGHSYGGAVISEAAAGAANVRALVYVAAFMPDAGEVLGELAARFPGSELQPALTAVPGSTADGQPTLDLYLDRNRFRPVFAADVPGTTTRLLAAVQRPLSASAFTDTATAAAWRTIPSWNLVATRDRGIPPALQRFQARRARSHTVEVASSHLPLYSRPHEVAALIRAAARSVTS